MAYIYCRISSVGQENGVSLDAQEQKLISICKELKWHVLHTQKIISSAYKKEPKGFEYYYNLKNKKILIYSVDRFSRDVMIGLETAKELIENKNTLYFVKEHLKLDDFNIEKWTRFKEHLSFAQQESELISERVTLGKRKAMEQGRFVGGRTPFGYKKIKMVSDGFNKLIPDVSVKPIIDFIIACRTKYTTVNELNQLLSECGANNFGKHKLILEDGNAKFIEVHLEYDIITHILNEYSIANRNWTQYIVKNIYNKFVDKNIFDVENIEELNKQFSEELYFDNVVSN
jgi:DNA invertase Pin-like site-specific DNA recombinase